MFCGCSWLCRNWWLVCALNHGLLNMFVCIAVDTRAESGDGCDKSCSFVAVPVIVVGVTKQAAFLVLSLFL